MRLLFLILSILISYSINAQVISGAEKIKATKGDTIFQITVSEIVGVSHTHPFTAITGVAQETQGGTGKSTYTTGDMLVASSTNVLGKLAAGADSTVLQSIGLNNVPTWAKLTITKHITGVETGKLIGRTTAGTGIPEFITVGTGLSLSAGTLSSTLTGLPSGTSGQTLRHNGSAWVANSVLYNDGTNIGIGTTGPGAKLEIATSTAGIAMYVNQTSATGTNYGVFSSQSGAATTNMGVYSAPQGLATNNVSFWGNPLSATNNIGLMIGNIAVPTGNYGVYVSFNGNNYFSGNVGIGQTNPSTARLVVESTTKQVQFNYSSTKWMGITVSATAATTFTPSDNTTTAFNFTNAAGTSVLNVDAVSQFVGIGTTGPGQLLEVYKSQNAATIALVNNPNTGSAAYAGFQMTSDGGSSILHRTSAAHTSPFGDATILQDFGGGDIIMYGAAEIARFKNTGNVGIGTIAPGANLHVVGSAGTGAASVIIGAETPSQNGTGTLDFRNSNSYQTWRITTGGTPLGRFDLIPSTVSAGSTYTTPVLSVQTNGNVGIGTISPDKLLGLGDGTDEFSLSVASDKLTFWNDAGTPVGLVYVDSSGNAGLGTTTNTTTRLGILASSVNSLGITLNAEGSHASQTGLYIYTNNTSTGSGTSYGQQIIAGSWQSGIVYGIEATAASNSGTGIGLKGIADAGTAVTNYGIRGVADNATETNVGIWGYSSMDGSTLNANLIFGDSIITNGNWGMQQGDNRSNLIRGNTAIGGTTAATDKLHVTGDMRLTGAFKDGSNSAGSNGLVMQSTGTTTKWAAKVATTGYLNTNVDSATIITALTTADNLYLSVGVNGSASDSARVYLPFPAAAHAGKVVLVRGTDGHGTYDVIVKGYTNTIMSALSETTYTDIAIPASAARRFICMIKPDNVTYFWLVLVE